MINPLLQSKIIEDRATVRWRCGFTGSNGFLIETGDGAHLVTDRRYETQARAQVTGARVHTPGYQLREYVRKAGLLDGCEQVGFQPEVRTVAAQHAWAGLFPEIAWVPMENLYAEARAAKTEGEVAHILAAQAITESVFAHILTLVEPGVTERELAAEITYQHLRQGAERMAFDPIVASGPHSALPHARPTDRKIQPDEIVLFDFGGVVNGYASDMTRTVVVGKATPEMQQVYGLVLAAQESAIEAAHAGIASNTLDEAARSVIREGGYGDQFAHSLGHGVGLETHEWPPVSFRSDVALPDGAVVTIEPGIYLPGRFGVRIEDMIQLTPEGCRGLTAASKAVLLAV